MKIVGLCGFAGSGKTTAAQNMPGYARFSFAEPLKNDLRGLLAGIGCDLNKREDKEKARPLLVAWGEVARAFFPNYWIDRLFDQLDKPEIANKLKAVVIDDLRYPNEARAILKRGGSLVSVHRQGYFGANETERQSIAEIDKLFPEIPLVANDGTPEELGRRVREAAGEF